MSQWLSRNPKEKSGSTGCHIHLRCYKAWNKLGSSRRRSCWWWWWRGQARELALCLATTEQLFVCVAPLWSTSKVTAWWIKDPLDLSASVYLFVHLKKNKPRINRYTVWSRGQRAHKPRAPPPPPPPCNGRLFRPGFKSWTRNYMQCARLPWRHSQGSLDGLEKSRLSVQCGIYSASYSRNHPKDMYTRNYTVLCMHVYKRIIITIMLLCIYIRISPTCPWICPISLRVYTYHTGNRY